MGCFGGASGSTGLLLRFSPGAAAQPCATHVVEASMVPRMSLGATGGALEGGDGDLRIGEGLLMKPGGGGRSIGATSTSAGRDVAASALAARAPSIPLASLPSLCHAISTDHPFFGNLR